MTQKSEIKRNLEAYLYLILLDIIKESIIFLLLTP